MPYNLFIIWRDLCVQKSCFKMVNQFHSEFLYFALPSLSKSDKKCPRWARWYKFEQWSENLLFGSTGYTTRQLDCVNNLTLKQTTIYRWGAQQLKSTNLSWIYKKLWLCTTSIIIWVCQKVVTTTSATSGSALQSAKMWRNSKQFWQATKNVSED